MKLSAKIRKKLITHVIQSVQNLHLQKGNDWSPEDPIQKSIGAAAAASLFPPYLDIRWSQDQGCTNFSRNCTLRFAISTKLANAVSGFFFLEKNPTAELKHGFDYASFERQFLRNICKAGGRTTTIFSIFELHENISQLTNFALELFFTGVDRAKRVIEPLCLPKRYPFNQNHSIAACGPRKLQQ
ncbi:MAG: hypothetical protein ABR572_06870 [Cryomorphaceae bacterium]|nr:hypothetical protein [Flavobacteriales bacterium]